MCYTTTRLLCPAVSATRTSMTTRNLYNKSVKPCLSSRRLVYLTRRAYHKPRRSLPSSHVVGGRSMASKASQHHMSFSPQPQTHLGILLECQHGCWSMVSSRRSVPPQQYLFYQGTQEITTWWAARARTMATRTMAARTMATRRLWRR